MSTIAKELLPPPARVDWSDMTVVTQSARTGILRTREPDPEVRPQEWTLHYERAHRSVVDALRRHYREHVHATFDWVPPGEADLVRVMHTAPPHIAWSTAAAATCQVFLEEVLAHD